MKNCSEGEVVALPLTSAISPVGSLNVLAVISTELNLLVVRTKVLTARGGAQSQGTGPKFSKSAENNS